MFNRRDELLLSLSALTVRPSHSHHLIHPSTLILTFALDFRGKYCNDSKIVKGDVRFAVATTYWSAWSCASCVMPDLIVEEAKSGRAKCSATGAPINKVVTRKLIQSNSFFGFMDSYAV